MYDTGCPGGSGVDAILLGQLSQPAEEPDTRFTKQLTAHMFAKTPPKGPGDDLVSINLHRNREHGIPGKLSDIVLINQKHSNVVAQLAYVIQT